MAKSVIYKISWGDCNKIYIKRTNKKVETRLREQLKESHLAEKQESKPFRPKVVEQNYLNDHVISKEDVTLLE